MVGDVLGRARRVPAPAPAQQHRGVAGDDRASQSARSCAREIARPDPDRQAAGDPRVRGQSRELGVRPVGGARGPSPQATTDNRVSLPRGDALRASGPDRRRQSGRRPTSGGRRYRRVAKDIPERRVPMSNERSLFAALPTIDDEVNRRLHRRLVDTANAAGLLDVAYRTIDTPVGVLLLAATPKGLVRVAYASQDHDLVLEGLARDVSPRILRAPARLDGVAWEIEEYFAGRRRTFDVPLDLQLSHGFRRTILSHLPEIGYGKTASYAAVAKAAGHPKAVRAAGSACASNPLPVVVPCHRVVRSDGTIGQYVGGVEAKRALLTLEGAA